MSLSAATLKPLTTLWTLRVGRERREKGERVGRERSENGERVGRGSGGDGWGNTWVDSRERGWGVSWERVGEGIKQKNYVISN